ncbi:MAG: tRNA preQ1(34) S-adenosylmethionine ribosyltransferase-isomerase QueA [Myxococcaceae bacterium]|nr:tRNA preQ1(34) S-adenosylmethionine ribosyltransferase-isomerase QueA [Myxococcaceae bacterium]
MRLQDFDFDLPPELIAQAPPKERDGGRLLHASLGGALEHLSIRAFPGLLRQGDVVVFNDARVIPARLLGKKVGTGGKAELLLVRPVAQVDAAGALAQAPASLEWTCLGQASKGLKPGTRLALDGGLEAEVTAALGGGEVRVRFHSSLSSLEAAIARAGQLPLPPYIDRPPTADDAERYQTVLARVPGSVAAPTAALHFTPQLLAAIDAAGASRVTVTLDVGPGTFLPVREDDLSKHVMHRERCRVPAETAAAIARARARGGRVVAIGTTVVRTLESSWADGAVQAGEVDTALFITPGYGFKAVDALLTNFHLPRSTLLMLVSAFLGVEATRAAYAAAVAERYRFFSYGDAMFVDRKGG